MRLTIADRDAFVRAAMDDVPTVDYQEKAQSLVNKTLRAAWPDALVKTIEASGLFDTDSFRGHVNMPCGLSSLYADWRPVNQRKRAEVLATIWPQLEEWGKANSAQAQRRADLSTKLRGAINGCTTLKQALERLPEFTKYLPQDRDGKIIRSMPAIANLVSDLMEAGWPKGEKK